MLTEEAEKQDVVNETSSSSSVISQQKENTLLRTQRRRNRKKLVTSASCKQPVERTPEKPTQQIHKEKTQIEEVLMKPALLAQTVTFKELEVRPICEGKIYVQRDHNFIPVSQEAFFLSSTQNLLDKTSSVAYSPEAIAHEFQKRCVPIATFCHGLLAGMALWHIFMVDASQCDKKSPAPSNMNIERSFQTIFYILSTISTVSVLEWCIPSRANSFKEFQRHLANNPLSLFALVACLGAHLTSNISAKLDDMAAFRLSNATSLIAASEKFEELHEQWLTLNLIRCILAATGFFLTTISRGNKF